MKPEDLGIREARRARFLKGGIIDQLQDHTPDTFNGLERVLKDYLDRIAEEREKLVILAKPLP